MKALDTHICVCLEINKNFLEKRAYGDSFLLVKTESFSDDVSTLFLEFDKKQTDFILDKENEDKVFFVEGKFKVLKNTKDVPFIKIKVYKIVSEEREKVLNTNELKNQIYDEFRDTNLRDLQDKYKEFNIDEEIKELKNIIENKEILELKERIIKQELKAKRMAIKLARQSKLDI